MGTTYSSNRDIIKFQAEGMRIYGMVLMSPFCITVRNYLVDGKIFINYGVAVSVAFFIIGGWVLIKSYDTIYRIREAENV